MDTAYYSWRGNDGTFSGLARNRGGEWAFAYGDGWALDRGLFGRLVNGDIEFEKIDDETAAGLAARYGVDLDAAAEYRWDAERREVVTVTDGTPAPPATLTAAAADPDAAEGDDFDEWAAERGFTREETQPVVWLLNSPEKVETVKKALGQ